MHFRFIYAVICINNSFIFIVEYSIVQMGYRLLFHSPSEEHLGCFQFSVLKNKGVINIHIVDFLCNRKFSFLLEWA